MLLGVADNGLDDSAMYTVPVNRGHIMIAIDLEGVWQCVLTMCQTVL